MVYLAALSGSAWSGFTIVVIYEIQIMSSDTIGYDPTPETLLWRAIVAGGLSSDSKLEKAGLTGKLRTEQIAAWFVSRCSQGLEPHQYDWPKTWAPAADQSFAWVTIDGDLEACKAITQDAEWPGNEFRWYDLQEVPERGAVWRISSSGTLWFFYKSPDEEDVWTAYAVPNFR